MIKIKKPKAEHGNLAALLDVQERETPGITVEQRRAAGGRKAIKPTDRRRRAEPRSKAYATNVTEAIKALAAKLTQEHDLTLAEFTERAILHYAEYLKNHGAKRNA